MILDTNFVIALREERNEAVATAREVENKPKRLPTVVVQELYVGVGAGSRPFENANAYESLIEHVPLTALDSNVSRRAGVIEGVHLASDSKPTLGIADAVIAATGLVHNEPVLTDDRSDFSTVDGLAVVAV